MVSSILTNNGAMTALQSLKSTQKNLLETQNRISTGLKVSTAKDNAATWAVATSMRAEIANFKQVSENLSVSSGVVATAAAGTEQIASLVSKIRESVTSVQDGVKDSATVQAAIDEYVAQIDSIIGSSAFKGVNLINNSRSGDEKILASVNANGDQMEPSYITVAQQNLTMAAGGALEGLGRLTVERAKDNYSYAAPTGAGVQNNDTLQFTFKVNGVERVAEFKVAVAGATATDAELATAMAGLKDAINTRAGSGNQFADIDANGKLVVNAEKAADVVTFDGETALAAKLDTGAPISFGTATNNAPPAPKYSYGLGSGAPAVGAKYSFEFEVDGAKQLVSYTALTGDDNAAVLKGLKDAINYAAGTGNEIASVDANTGKLVVDAALGQSKVEFKGETALKLQDAAAAGTLAAATGATATRALAGIVATAGNTVRASFTINGTTHNIDQVSAATAMTAAEAGTFVDAINAAAGFKFAYLNQAGDGLVFDQSLAPSPVSGFLLTDFTASTTASISTAGASTGQTYDMADVANVAADERVEGLSFSLTDVSGAAQVATVSRLNADETDAQMLSRLVTEINSKAGVAAGNEIASIDANGKLFVDAARSGDADTAVTGLQVTKSGATGVADKLTPASSTDYSDLLAKLKTVETAVLAAGAAFGAAQTRIDLQKDFMDKLVDTLTSGVGALVDADMSEEAARLQALQVQEQLGTQALSIANQAPQSILSLFRG